ncbi:hypothetical protein ALC62_13393 [Cyphomyrmex costatus]|uniref:Uncharacterized protein n=1 Tax=Cyphomyrmex costatus TaxID=456900 RepID=A0A195C5N8_9HYME|nr:hypothetical protein ALC62_13393 [Cyphomyrmex costatus]
MKERERERKREKEREKERKRERERERERESARKGKRRAEIAEDGKTRAGIISRISSRYIHASLYRRLTRGCTRRRGFSRIASRAIPSALDPRTSTTGPLGIARNCSRRKRYSRQGDARDERGLGRMESKPTGKAGGDETKGGIEHHKRRVSLCVLG